MQPIRLSFGFNVLFGMLAFIGISAPSLTRAEFSLDKFAVAVGAEYLSQLDRRGIVTYGSFQLIPIYAVDLFHPSLQLVGSTLNWRQSLSESTLYRARLNFDAANDVPLYYTTETESSRIRRETSGELELFLEQTIANVEATLNLGSGIIGHSGFYGEGSVRVKLGKYVPKGSGFLIEPALTASIGGGSSEHNRYYYGLGSEAGVSYSTVGFSIASPGIVDHFYPWLKVYRSTLMGTNRDASYVKANEREHWTFLILAAFKIW